ncbi:hypothetical protein MKW92_027650 [Papaver armeniacum]|nr:hypothetical protein MKW92_027650 [Papaver armeniacum]
MEIEFPRITEDEDFLKGVTTRRKLYKYPIEESAEGRPIVSPFIKLEEDQSCKERGNGFIKLLKHKETKKFRLVMRQSGTLKVIANHLGSIPTHASDFSNGELKEEVLCARFVYMHDAKLFKEMVVEAAASQVQKSEESKEGATSLAADLTENLNVGENKDVPNIFRISTDAESRVQNSEESKEGATSLAAIIDKIDVSGI